MIKRRKKACRCCGEKFWLREFYRTKQGWIGSYCKECTRRQKREEYQRNRKVPDRIYKDFDADRLMQHEGTATRIYWTGPMIERLKRDFATTKNADLAVDLNVSPRTVVRKARELGLEKSKAWQQAHARANCKTMRILNKCCGNSGQFKKGQHASPATEFKKKTI